AFFIVEADGPEAVDWHIPDVELVDRVAVVLLGRDVEIGRILVGVAAPGCGRCDQMPARIDLLPGAERLLEVGHGRSKNKQRITNLLLAGLVPVRNFELSRPHLRGLDPVLEYVNLCDV